jgi:hypothetical protein
VRDHVDLASLCDVVVRVADHRLLLSEVYGPLPGPETRRSVPGLPAKRIGTISPSETCRSSASRS